MEKKLYRSSKDKKLAGVCGGVAEYIGVDATIVRLGWALFCFIGAGILAYIVAAIIMPEAPADAPADTAANAAADTTDAAAAEDNKPEQL